MVGQLLAKSPLEHRLGHLSQQPARAQQLDAFCLGARDQLICERLIDKRRRLVRFLDPHDRSVVQHAMSFPDHKGPRSGHALTQTI